MQREAGTDIQQKWIENLALPDNAPLQRRLSEFLSQPTANRVAGGAGELWLGTNIGGVRSENQDRAAILAVSGNTPHLRFVVAVLADGIGGLSNGAEAATVAASTFLYHLVRHRNIAYPQRLIAAAHAANDAVYGAFGGKSGSTLSAVYVGPFLRPVGINIGDSRIYGINFEGRLTALSKDDNLGSYVKNPAIDFGNRNQLLQYVGMGEGIEPHLIEIDPNAYARLALTSDGIHSVNVDIMNQIARNSTTSQDIVRRLVNLNDLSGGIDNGTAVVIPSSISIEMSEPYGDALSLSAYSPSSHLEIWIVPQAEPSTVHGASPRNDPAVEEARQSKSRKHSRRKRRAPSSQGSAPSDDAPGLPLDEQKPTIKIDFPDRREG